MPEVVFVKDFKIDGEFRSICILKKLKGNPLKERNKSKDIGDELKSILTKAGSVLSDIHSIKVDRFGRLGSNGMGKYKTWLEYILGKVSNLDQLKQIARKNNINPDLITQAEKVIRGNEDVLEGVEAHLLHGDFGNEHIFVDGNTITGIIDFEDAKGGDPVWDFAWWDFFHKDKEKIKWLIEGYGNKKLFENNFDLKLNLYKLCLSLDLMYYYDYRNFMEGLLIAKNNLEKALSSL